MSWADRPAAGPDRLADRRHRPYASGVAFLRRLPLLAVFVVVALAFPAGAAAAGAPPAPAQAPNLPWGAGCEPAPDPALRTAANCGASLVDGDSVPPPNAPALVKQVMAAADEIDGKPYIWGGGHLGFLAKGYDCSGAVGYALHGAGLLDYTQVSGQLAHYGEAGPGRWISIYANDEHVFMVVAGLRFDTRDDPQGVSGPRWKMAAPPASILPAFSVRHPAGL